MVRALYWAPRLGLGEIGAQQAPQKLGVVIWPVTKMCFSRRTKRVNRAGSVDALLLGGGLE